MGTRVVPISWPGNGLGAPSIEQQYRASAFVLQQNAMRHFLMLLAATAGYAMITTATRVAVFPDLVWRVLPLHAAAVLCSAITLLIAWRANGTHTKPRHSLLALAALCIGVAIASRRLDHSGDESHALTAVYLSCYGLLVPALPLRRVAIVTAIFVIGLMMLLLGVESERSVVLRELVKIVGVSAIGLMTALNSDRNHRINFEIARRFKEETKQHRQATAGVQRLLMNTLPAPVVRAVARVGAGQVAHRYDMVTVLQADMVGFTPLSASRSAEDILLILGELFYEFDRSSDACGVHKLKTIGDACKPRSGSNPELASLPPLPR